MSYVTISTVKTGRFRTLKMSGSWAGTNNMNGGIITGYLFWANENGHALTLLQKGYWGINFIAGPAADQSLSADYAGIYPNTSGRVQLSFGWDGAIAPYIIPLTPPGYYDTGYSNVPISPPLYLFRPYTWDGGGTGTWEYDIDVEEYYDVQIEIDDNTGLPVYPSYGGKPQQDPPLSNKLVFYELAKPGGLMSLTVKYTSPNGIYRTFPSYGGGQQGQARSNVFAGSIRAKIAYPFPVIYITGGSLSTIVERGTDVGSPAATGGMSAVFDNTFSQYALINDFDSVRDHSGVGDLNGHYKTDGITHTMTVASNTSQVNPSGICWHTLFFSLSLPKLANVDVHVYEDKNDYADPTKVFVAGDKGSDILSVSNGSAGKAIYQGFASALSIFEFKASLVYKQPAKSVAYDTRQPIAAFMSHGSALVNREDPDDWRMMWRGLPFQSFTLQQKQNFPIDNGISISPNDPLTCMPGGWSVSTPASITVISDGLSIAVTDGKNSGTAVRSFNDAIPGQFKGACFGGYRWLYIKIRGTADSLPFRLRLTNLDGDKYWDLKTGALGVMVVIGVDLLNPHNKTAATDSVDSLWPYVGDSMDFHIKDGDYAGVTHVTTLTLENLSNAQTYDVGGLYLASLYAPKISSAPSFKYMIDEYDDDPLTDQIRVRVLNADTDGRQSLEASDLRMDVLGNLTTYTLEGVRQACDLKRNGWKATAVPPGSFPDSYHNNGLEGCFLWGQGAFFGTVGSETKPGWHSGFDRS